MSARTSRVIIPAAPANPQQRVGGRPVALAREALLMLGTVLVYFGVRGLTEGSVERAVENAHTLVRLERWFGIYWEPAFQRLVTADQLLLTLANWVYIWGHWPVIILVAGWLFLRHPGEYRVIRTAILVSGGIGLLIFMLFPVAPPRLAGLGLLDTVTTYSHSYRVMQPPALVNQYAAFPSLHFGWDLLIGIALVRTAGGLWRWLGYLLPVLMFLAVVTTANHFIIDPLGGGALALFGLLIARRLRVTIVWPWRVDRRDATPPERT